MYKISNLLRSIISNFLLEYVVFLMKYINYIAHEKQKMVACEGQLAAVGGGCVRRRAAGIAPHPAETQV